MINRQIKEAYDRIDPDAAAAKRIWSRINEESVEGSALGSADAEPNWNELARPETENAPARRASAGVCKAGVRQDAAHKTEQPCKEGRAP